MHTRNAASPITSNSLDDSHMRDHATPVGHTNAQVDGRAETSRSRVRCWHSQDGPDVVANGLVLCALHHALFDLGVLGLTAELRRGRSSEAPRPFGRLPEHADDKAGGWVSNVMAGRAPRVLGRGHPAPLNAIGGVAVPGGAWLRGRGCVAGAVTAWPSRWLRGSRRPVPLRLA